MREMILKLMLIALIFVNIFSLTRLDDIQKELYFGKYIIILLLSAILFFVTILKKKHLKLQPQIQFICITFAMWIFFMMTSLFDAPSPLSGILVILSYFVLAFLSFILIPSQLNDDIYLRYNRLFWASLVLAFMLSIILCINDPNNFHTVGDRIRYQAFFANPNSLGMVSLLGVLSSAQVYAISQQRRYILTVLPALFLLYLSNSRASMLAAGVAILMMVFLSLLGRCRSRTKMLLKVSVYMALGTMIFLGFIAAYLAPEGTLNDLASQRLSIWSSVLGSSNDIQWLFGQGIGKEGLGSLSFDSFYVNTLVQTGLSGLSAFVVFIISVLYGLFHQLKKKSDDIVLQVSIASLVACLIYSFFESALFSLGNILSIYIWANIGYQLAKDKRDFDILYKTATLNTKVE
jgi:O-antigen ligase